MLVFVRCPQEKVKSEVYKSRYLRFFTRAYWLRITEWLHGVRLVAPDDQTRAALNDEEFTDAERLRVVHLLITSPERDGGAGVTPGLDGWNYVESIFPLHDSKFNRVYSEETCVDYRNGSNPGLANGLSTIPNWIQFATTSVRSLLFTLRGLNITSSHLYHFLCWVYFPTFSSQSTTLCIRLALCFGQWGSNVPGRGEREICLLGGVLGDSHNLSNSDERRTLLKVKGSILSPESDVAGSLCTP